jgi:hypothetical protein
MPYVSRVLGPEASAWGRHSLRPLGRIENCQCGADARDEEGEQGGLGLSLGREPGGGMSFLVQRQVGPGHVQHSAYDTPEEALDAAITLMSLGVMSVHIIDQRRRRHKKPGPPNWTGEPA